MTDRIGNEFTLACDEYKTSTQIFNCDRIYLADRVDELSKFDFITLYFTYENPAEVKKIISEYKNKKADLSEKYTRGLAFRKVH